MLEILCFVLLTISGVSLLALIIRDKITKCLSNKKVGERVTVIYNQTGCPYCGNKQYESHMQKCNRCGYTTAKRYKF